MQPHDYIMHAELLDDNYLAHYGVKGMKWGVRRARGRVMNSNAYTNAYIRQRKARGMASAVVGVGARKAAFAGTMGKMHAKDTGRRAVAAGLKANAARKGRATGRRVTGRDMRTRAGSASMLAGAAAKGVWNVAKGAAGDAARSGARYAGRKVEAAGRARRARAKHRQVVPYGR